MKIINESKKQTMPVDFITNFVSKSWAEVGSLKADIEAVKQNFTDAKKVTDILQDLSDAYLIAVGQLEALLGKKGLEVAEEKDLKEALTEAKEKEEDENETDSEADNKEDNKLADAPEKVTKQNDGNKVEIFTELPDYDVEVEQKGEKVEVEVEPKKGKFIGDGKSGKEAEDKDLGLDRTDLSDEAAFEVNNPFDTFDVDNLSYDNTTPSMSPNGFFDNGSFNAAEEDKQRFAADENDMFNMEFGEPSDEDDAEARDAIQQWKNRHSF